jgi:hypothetical protein
MATMVYLTTTTVPLFGRKGLSLGRYGTGSGTHLGALAPLPP